MRSLKLIAILGTVLPAFAQEYSKQDVSVQALGSFVKSTWDKGIEQSSTDSGGVLASYRYFFNKHSGVEVNYAFTSNTVSYSGLGGVDSRSSEVSAAYVFRVPLKHFTPFLLAGTGGVVFDPKDFAGASTQTRAAFVYGGGADFNVGPHVFIRAEYRGLVYNSPTYDVAAFNGADRTTHRAEPSIGIGYRF
jgi:opacity protein-like surface antigen